MKKQVLSFTEFVNESYYMMINEGKTWEDVKTLLADMIDNETAEILAYVEDCLGSDARKGIKGIDLLASAGLTFSKVISDRFDGKYTDIVEVKTAINDIEYNEVIQGSFYVVKGSPIGSAFSMGGDSKSIGAFTEQSGMMKMEDLLNLINLKNMNKLGGVYAAAVGSGKEAEFANIGKGDKAEADNILGRWFGVVKAGERKKIRGSGSQDQYYITKADPQIQIEKWENKAKVTPFTGVETVNMSADIGNKRVPTGGQIKGLTKDKEQRSKKASMAEFTYVFYALDPKSVTRGKGKGVKKTFTDVKEVKIEVKDPTITESLEIQDNGVLFTVNTATLTDQGKKNIYNALSSNFTSIAEIEVQGSASQEGDKANNEKLCKDRAAAVVTYLKTVTGAKLTASETANIQPATPVADEATRKTWRNVILTIKGTKINPGEKKDKIIYVPITGKVACDKVTIKELQMTFVVQIDPDKAKKGGLFKKGVDTDNNKVRSRD
jgi:outer membrane protein OmpA-like peptidoglycan-associated protein